jgi:hypothetical protein
MNVTSLPGNTAALTKTKGDEHMDRDFRELTEREIDHVSGGAITTETTTKSGNDTQGHGNGLTTVAKNPAGNEPPGQQ